MTQVLSDPLPKKTRYLDLLTVAWVPTFLFMVSIAALNHDPRMVSDVTYGLILVFLVGGLALAFLRRSQIDWSRLNAIPIVLFALWLYGAALGLANGVAPGLVFRNFAAMSLFPFVYFMLVALAPKPKGILVALIGASVVYVLAVAYLLVTVQPKGSVDTIGLMSLRYHYYLTTIAAVAVMLALSIKSAVLGQWKAWQLVLCAAVFVAAFYSGSRAFYAAMALSMLVLGLAFLPRWVLFSRAVTLGLVYLVAGVALIWASVGSFDQIGAAVAQSVEMEVDASSPRSQQLAQLWPGLSWFGQGLGAPLASGYERDPVLTYAFELSYISLAHKVGFAGLAVFLACVSVHLVRCFRTLVRSNYRAEMILAIGLMGFLVSSWWNPTIFAPLFVCLFCVSMYIERSISREIEARPI